MWSIALWARGLVSFRDTALVRFLALLAPFRNLNLDDERLVGVDSLELLVGVLLDERACDEVCFGDITIGVGLLSELLTLLLLRLSEAPPLQLFAAPSMFRLLMSTDASTLVVSFSFSFDFIFSSSFICTEAE